MGCEIRNTKDGVMILCIRGRKAQKCRWCKAPAVKLCDHPRGKGTCDAPCCIKHATHVAYDRDRCPDHAP